ncbi:MAG: LysR substrate-binding domain-containing protein [Candidatus Competibacter sp.]|nr:LysR substrate-binding domain-containing protein [Candidatus Competibacter sp.]
MYASPAYVERAGRIASPAQLAQAHCLNLQTSQGPMPWVVGGHCWNDAPGSCTISANSVALLRTLAEEGHGVALLPRHLVRVSLQASKLVPVLEAEKTISWPLYAITASRLITKGLRLLIAHVKNELRTSHSEVL